MSVAVYPGSFDPITNGHLDIIGRAADVFDRVIVAVLANPRKTPLLPVEERIARDPRGARRRRRARRPDRGRELRRPDRRLLPRPRATAIVRGLRAISDFETEMQLAHNNRVLAPDVDTVFFMTSIANGYVSSSLVKEIASFGGDVRRCSRRRGRRPWRPPSAVADRDGGPRAIIGPTRRATDVTGTAQAGGHEPSTSSSSSSASSR